MNSLRIETILSLIEASDKVIDIGTDHAYLPIKLILNGQEKVLATDIHPKVLNKAKENIQKYHLENNIILKQADGLNNIDTFDYNTLVIAGMGYTTIKNILSNQEKLKPIKKIIIQTNNDYYQMRTYMNQNNWCLIKEIVIKEKKQNYHLMVYEKKAQKLSNDELYYGLYSKENLWYYEEEIDHQKQLLKKIPSNEKEKIKEIQNKINILNKYLSKEKILAD